MTLQGARRDTRTFETFSLVTRDTLDLERPGLTGDGDRRRADPSFRRDAATTRRTTRLLPTGLW